VSQINVNPPPSVEPVDSGDRTAAAGINLITVVIVLGVLAIIAWYLFTGPLRGIGSASSGQTNVNVQPPQTTVNVQPPNGSNPAPANNNTGGGNQPPANQP
jgi:hypothetical protein